MSTQPLPQLDLDPTRREPPALPVPSRRRFQPLRLGLVELFHYDAEEFWFRDGHLLLRGNNGTGKSKVLALTLPFLFDASLSPVRVEPDGDRAKRMEWNLLMGRYERRVGYTWVEFGRCDEDGVAHYVTLGCGLSAVDGRPRVVPWHFITDQRVGAELLLIGPDRIAISRERLGAAIGGRGQVFDTAREYRRAVDERLFQLGDRYDGLIDTLIQLRQPQLSKKPDERHLSQALSNALPELPRAVLQDVADAMNQLDEFREELLQLDRVRETVEAFAGSYRAYAQIQARRCARSLRQAQTEFDKQSQAVSDARSHLEQAAAAAQTHRTQAEACDAQLRRDRASLDELKSDPGMRDVRRLEDLERLARECTQARDKARGDLERATQLRAAETVERERREGEHELARAESDACAKRARQQAERTGLAAEHDRLLSRYAEAAGVAEKEPGIERALSELAERRSAHIARVHEHLRACEEAEAARQAVAARCDDRRAVLDRAEAEARAADDGLAREAQALVAAFTRYVGDLQVLSLAEPDAGLVALEEWVQDPTIEHPLLGQVHAAHAQALRRLAEEEGGLREQRTQCEAEDAALAQEQDALQSGKALAPPALPARRYDAREARPGAPLWALLEFRDHVSAADRAGLEAALEAAGVLDAWVSPEGQVLHADAEDAWLTPGAVRPASLLDWLAPGPSSEVAAERLSALLASMAAGAHEDEDADSWFSPRGQFRVGRLRGALQKGQAQYLGAEAREAARRRRLAEIALQRDALASRLQALSASLQDLRAREARLGEELSDVPDDTALRTAHAHYASQEQARRRAQEQLAEAEAALQQALDRLQAQRNALRRDAGDLNLPAERAALAEVERALLEYRAQGTALAHALQARARTLIELDRQRQREQQAMDGAEEAARVVAACGRRLDEACARRDTQQGLVGAAVAEFKHRLRAANEAVERGEQALESERLALNEAQERRARADERLTAARMLFEERSAARLAAVEALQRFSATGLLGTALPELQPPASGQWSVDPALSLARRMESALANVSADDADWQRAQQRFSPAYDSLNQNMSALGQRVTLEPTDFGMVVQIVYGNRPERPDVLQQRLARELEARRGILSAREQEVLENHLQAEVAAYLQRLLREAEARVARINEELKRRPTSTGVYFRLEWEPLPEGDKGAPVGLATARTRLLRRTADAWSVEDRKAVGAFLQARIEAERANNDLGSLAEHLARALDYRQWHRFVVKRWHDGAFRPLSGPASSGERALGLTVPLFAAASSHYGSGGATHAPRLVLLDEAFAGIDDEARAHCMALIREFDLDFVMTSEREWGCYATLPGVSICQIIRREGIDAVYVSRWTWDGNARSSQPDPGRRFATTDGA